MQENNIGKRQYIALGILVGWFAGLNIATINIFTHFISHDFFPKEKFFILLLCSAIGAVLCGVAYSTGYYFQRKKKLKKQNTANTEETVVSGAERQKIMQENNIGKSPYIALSLLVGWFVGMNIVVINIFTHFISNDFFPKEEFFLSLPYSTIGAVLCGVAYSTGYYFQRKKKLKKQNTANTGETVVSGAERQKIMQENNIGKSPYIALSLLVGWFVGMNIVAINVAIYFISNDFFPKEEFFLSLPYSTIGAVLCGVAYSTGYYFQRKKKLKKQETVEDIEKTVISVVGR